MDDRAARCDLLELELAEARERIHQLEAEMGVEVPVPISFRLTASEARILGLIIKRPMATKSQAMAALYSGRAEADEPIDKIVDVLVCKMRSKLKPFRVQVETVWGQGWTMAAESKAKVKALLEEENAR